ncbi:hypothetical protein D3C83_248070 [compost metagenome]
MTVSGTMVRVLAESTGNGWRTRSFEGSSMNGMPSWSVFRQPQFWLPSVSALNATFSAPG